MNTADEVESMLAAKFCAPEYAFLSQVRNGTGFSRRQVRTIDALAMSLYPSRGLHLSGIEIKVSRADWVRELKDPDKAEDIARFCDFWYVAVGEGDIVRDGELPPPWGLLAPKAGKLVVTKQPTILEAKPVDRLFLAAILRNVSLSNTPTAAIADKLEARYQEGIEHGKEDRRFDLRDFKALKEKVAAFEEASGIPISRSWDGGKRIGEAVKLVLETDMRAKNRLLRIRNDTHRIVADLDTLLAAVDDDAPPALAVGED